MQLFITFIVISPQLAPFLTAKEKKTTKISSPLRLSPNPSYPAMSMIKSSTENKVASSEPTYQKPDTPMASRSSLALSETASLSDTRPLLLQSGAKASDESLGSILKKNGANREPFTYLH